MDGACWVCFCCQHLPVKHMNVRIFWVCVMERICAQTRPSFILSSKRVWGGMESEPILTPREKSPPPEKFSSKEYRTHDISSSRTASPKHYQRAIPVPAPYAGCLVLLLADRIKVGLGWSAACCHAVLQHWWDLHCTVSWESWCLPPVVWLLTSSWRQVARLLTFGVFFFFFLFFFHLLLPCQSLVKSHPRVGRVVLRKHNVTIDLPNGLLFFSWEAACCTCGFLGVGWDMPLFCPTFQCVQWML